MTRRWQMTTLDTLGSADPDLDEVSDAALAMADFDAKRRDYATALDWLAVAAQHRTLTREYRDKKLAWESGRQPPHPHSPDGPRL
jgi:predicted ABC-class ATPase